MSATSGTRTLRRSSSARIGPRFSASFFEGAVMRTISQPASTSRCT
jgi:hypothetical protein